ncbi:MAG: FAD-dependent oxidoreductase [Candidatus Gastranaerophilales bacterium]|nr:FAD-dependent oxidoreductase [Candidatus Gastranaerophilales bacterium]
MCEFDFGIVGGGPAGYTAALYAAQQGKSVILFEKDSLGGTCLNRGCIPTKAFMHVADLYAEIKDSAKLGLTCENIKVDFEKVVEHKNNVVNKLYKSLELVMKNAKIKFVNEEAKIVDKNTIKAGGEDYKVEKIIAATGSVPREIKGLEFDHKFVLSSDDILNMTKLPESIAIVGSGAIGTEWARILSTFGVEVSVIELADRLVPLADWEVSKRIERIFKMKKIKTYLSTSVDKIENNSVLLSNGDVLTPECVLVAVGRQPVRPDTNIEIEYIGDACGEIQLAHYAMNQAKNIVLNIPFDKKIVPSVIYGTPEIAWVGEVCKTKEDDENYEKVLMPISALGKAHCDNCIEGFIKILAKDGKIKGASIISKEASSLIQQLVIAMQNNISVDDLKQVCFAHPTYSEGIFEGIMRL